MAAIDSGDAWSVTATHATAAVASKAGATNKTHYITGFSVSSDKASSILLVKQGTTTVWEMQIGAGKESYRFVPPIKAASGALVSAEIDGTAACKANIIGFTI